MRSAAIIASFIFALSAQAQLLTAQGVGIAVNNGAQLHRARRRPRDFRRLHRQHRHVDLTGDFTNNSANGLFSSSQGTVLLNGGSQSVGGSSVTLFNNLSLLGGPIAPHTGHQHWRLSGNDRCAFARVVAVVLEYEEALCAQPGAGRDRAHHRLPRQRNRSLAGYGEVQWFIGPVHRATT
ncbi:MAG: hypothetical protein IPI55_17270 [Flavobacteriales bacterium]|nr:hypothetical protein [Flavobacteriales bacterium]